MAMLILEEAVEKELIRRRQMHGHDRFDEVWHGVYVMAPSADNQHQAMSSDLNTVFQVCIDWNGLGKSMATPNVSDRVEDWTQNFRIPDLAVFLVGTTAVDYQSFWHGGPDFVVEIASENDKTDEKLPFYESVQTREVLIVDRDPWRLRLYRLVDGILLLVATSTLDRSEELRSTTIPLTFRLAQQEGKAVILVTNQVTSQTWTIQPRDLPPRRTTPSN
jgi:hypothetical protein